ncbi:MAG: hypothetical protein Q8Q35_04410, partial [Nanoarchaeota archaeon]|nr:hypothetical protein [Nanoarchaeota archaeon]
MNIGSILSNEFDIELTREEISKLQKESLRSFVKMTTRDGEKIDRWFEIIRGEISERQLYLDM